VAEQTHSSRPALASTNASASVAVWIASRRTERG
jgi:hypothetical protein